MVSRRVEWRSDSSVSAVDAHVVCGRLFFLGALGGLIWCGRCVQPRAAERAVAHTASGLLWIRPDGQLAASRPSRGALDLGTFPQVCSLPVASFTRARSLTRAASDAAPVTVRLHL
jgi:hypothetical protein